MSLFSEGVLEVRDFWRSHGTKLLGLAQVTISGLAIPGVFPTHIYPYVLAASGVLTAWRGFVNSANAQK